MPYISTSYEHLEGKAVGSGECVAYVQRVAGAPPTGSWTRGEHVKGAHIKAGTVIATFSKDGKYENISGKSHAAIYIYQDQSGIHVYDQWRGHEVSRRVLRFGASGASNDGDQFYVVD